MSSLNKAQIIGNVCKDPEVKYATNGDAICNLTVATNETWKDKNTGEKKESAEFHRVSMFGKLAEIAGQYLKKGSSVYIEGKITTRKYVDKDGIERYTTEIRANEMKMLGGKPEGGSAPTPRQESKPQRNAQAAPPDAFDDLDIPFACYGRGRIGNVL